MAKKTSCNPRKLSWIQDTDAETAIGTYVIRKWSDSEYEWWIEEWAAGGTETTLRKAKKAAQNHFNKIFNTMKE